MSYSLFLFNYQFYLVLDDNRGMIIAKQRRPPLLVSVYFVLDSNQGIIIVKSYRLVGSLRGVVGCCNTYSNMIVFDLNLFNNYEVLQTAWLL